MVHLTYSTFALLVCSHLVDPTSLVIAARREDARQAIDHLSASELLDKGIQALGGQNALQGLKSVSSHALLVVVSSS